MIIKAIGSFSIGGLVMVLSSVSYMSFTQIYKHTEKYDITVGDIIATSGQTLGQMGFIYAFILLCEIFREFADAVQVGIIAGWLMLSLGFYDLIDIFFLNPFEVSVSKFLGFFVAILITVARLIWFKNG